MRKLSVLAVAGAAALLMAGVALADNISVSFEPPVYHLGSPNGQDGWTKSGPYDVAVVANTYGYPSFQKQSLRLSDAIVSGAFGDQTFAKPLVNGVGETSATAATFSVGSRQRHFEMEFDIASTMQARQPAANCDQAGGLCLHLSVSPDRGDGSRMSYLRFEDGATGIDVFFDDVQGTSNPANFVETQVATGLSRAKSHKIKLTLDTLDGPSNDVVKVYIDDNFVHKGTSWENYYRYDSEASAEQSPRIVKTVLFREGGTAIPADQGKGFLVDNFNTRSGPTDEHDNDHDGDHGDGGDHGDNGDHGHGGHHDPDR